MFIDFAVKCRVDIGYRLLRRCLRHAFDSRTESLDNKTAKLILYEGNVGILLTTPIPASMKKEKYKGSTALTTDMLLCCDCGCKSGGTGNQRVACVHSLARAYLLSVLLAEDLAEHMLLELSSLVTSPEIEQESGWDGDAVTSMRESIVTLMKASGNCALAEEMTSVSTMHEMLQKFRTGTERTKEWNRQHKPPQAEHKGPMDVIVLDTPEHKAQIMFNRVTPKNKQATDRDAGVELFIPDYIATDRLLEAAGISPARFEPVGFKLFQSRLMKEKARMAHVGDEIEPATNLLKQQWILMMKEAETRCHRNKSSMKQNTNASIKRKSNATSTCHHHHEKGVFVSLRKN
jgi:hypothetical protein